MVAGLAAGIERAHLLTLKEVNELVNRCFFDAKAFLGGVRSGGVYTREPGRMSEGRRRRGRQGLIGKGRCIASRFTKGCRFVTKFGFEVSKSILQFAYVR